MKKTLRRAAAKSSFKSAVPELSPVETKHLEQISRRYAEAENAWQKMASPPEGDETWAHVEEHLLENTAQDQDRRWKFFSK